MARPSKPPSTLTSGEQHTLNQSLVSLSRSSDGVKAQIPKVILKATDLLDQRAEAYDGLNIDDYMPLGFDSYFQMVYLKAQRLRSQHKNKADVSDSLIDLLNYTLFALAYLELQGKTDFADSHLADVYPEEE